MACQVVEVSHIIRRMRGSSQSHLVRGRDARAYVAKFTGNPNGNRTLINEWIGFRHLQSLRVSTPALQILQLTEQVREENADLCFHVGSETRNVQAGLHLGSLCPVDPATTAIWDFLPRKLFGKIVNLEDFAKVFVVDQLLGLSGFRQAIFVCERSSEGTAYRAYFVDHGELFAGNTWEADSRCSGLYFDKTVYNSIDMRSLCEVAVGVITATADIEQEEYLKGVPPEWLTDGDHEAMTCLLGAVRRRKSKLKIIIDQRLGELSH